MDPSTTPAMSRGSLCCNGRRPIVGQKAVDLQLPKVVQLLFLTALRVLQSTQRKAREEDNLDWTGE